MTLALPKNFSGFARVFRRTWQTGNLRHIQARLQLYENGDRFERSSLVNPFISHFSVFLARCCVVRLLHWAWETTQASQKDKCCSVSERQAWKYILVRAGKNVRSWARIMWLFMAKVYFRTGLFAYNVFWGKTSFCCCCLGLIRDSVCVVDYRIVGCRSRNVLQFLMQKENAKLKLQTISHLDLSMHNNLLQYYCLCWYFGDF